MVASKGVDAVADEMVPKLLGATTQVGVMTNVSKPLVTAYCDRKLQFHHAPQ